MRCAEDAWGGDGPARSTGWGKKKQVPQRSPKKKKKIVKGTNYVENRKTVGPLRLGAILGRRKRVLGGGGGGAV